MTEYEKLNIIIFRYKEVEIIKIDSYQCVTDKSFRDDINSRNNTEELEFEGIIDCLGDKASFQYSYFAGNENCTDGYVVRTEPARSQEGRNIGSGRRDGYYSRFAGDGKLHCARQRKRRELCIMFARSRPEYGP